MKKHYTAWSASRNQTPDYADAADPASAGAYSLQVLYDGGRLLAVCIDVIATVALAAVAVLLFVLDGGDLAAAAFLLGSIAIPVLRWRRFRRPKSDQ